MQTNFKKLLSLILVCTILSSLVVALVPATVVFAAGETVSPTSAPYAGVYQVTSDKAVTLTNETGHIVSLLPGEPNYTYLIAGANNLTISNPSANLTFVALQGNGLAYLDQVSQTKEPIPVGQEDVVVTFATKDEPHLDPGESYTFTYTPSKGMNGIVYPYLAFNDPNEYVLKITTDTGYQTHVEFPVETLWREQRFHRLAHPSDVALLLLLFAGKTLIVREVTECPHDD